MGTSYLHIYTDVQFVIKCSHILYQCDKETLLKYLFIFIPAVSLHVKLDFLYFTCDRFGNKEVVTDIHT